jgi:hypothetical protein
MNILNKNNYSTNSSSTDKYVKIVKLNVEIRVWTSTLSLVCKFSITIAISSIYKKINVIESGYLYKTVREMLLNYILKNGET